MTFNSVADMTHLSTVPQPNETCTLLGYYQKDDKGGGEFYWDNASNEPENLGTIFKAYIYDNGEYEEIIPGRWKRVYTSSLNVRWFGAKGDGIVDDRDALNRCIQTGGTGSEILLGRGVYRLTAGLSYLGYSNVRFVGDRCIIKADFTGGALFTFSVNQAASQPRSEGIEFVDINFVGTGYDLGTTCFSFNGYSKTATPTTGQDYSYFWYIRIIHCNINDFDTAIRFNICRDILVDNCHLVDNKNGIYFVDKHVESMVRDTIILCKGSDKIGSYCIKSEATYSGDFPTNEGLAIEGSTLDAAQYAIYAKNATMWKVIGNYIGIQMPYYNSWYMASPNNRAYSILIERGSALAKPANTRVCTISNNNIYQGAIKITNLVNDVWSMLSDISDNIFAAMNDNCIEIGPRVTNLNITGIYAEKASAPDVINGAIIELDSEAGVFNFSKLTSNQKFVNAVNIKGSNVTFTNIEGVMHAGSGPVINNPFNNSITVSNIRGNNLPIQKTFANVAVNTYNSSNPLSLTTASIPVFNGMKGRITLVGAFNPSVAGQVLQLATSGVSVTIPNAPGSSAQFHKLYGTGMRMISHVIPFTANATGNLSVGLAVLDYLGGTTGVDYHSFLTIETDAY